MQIYKDGMMNRIGWFLYLRTVFEDSTPASSHKGEVLKCDFIKKLSAIQRVNSSVNQNLPLKPVDEYNKTTGEIGFTLTAVYEMITNDNIERLSRLTSVADHRFKVILIGEKGTGKTTLLNRIAYNKFTENYESTVVFNYIKLFYKVTLNDSVAFVQIMLWDTSGEERYHAVTKMYFKDSHAALLLYDTTKKETLDKADFWVDVVKQETNPCASIYLIGSKVDKVEGKLVEDDDVDSLQKSNEQVIKAKTLISSKTGHGVEDLFKSLIRIMLETPKDTAEQRKTLRLSAKEVTSKDDCKC